LAENHGYVALTFDDGPHPDTTLPLLAALRAGGAGATFFIRGEQAARHRDLLRAVRADGHGIANHTYTHPHLTEVDDGIAVREIDETQAIVREITGQTPTLFRPPYGDTDARVRGHAARFGLTEVLWTVDTRDWADTSTDEIVAAAANVQPGGIILMHDYGYRTTVAAVPRILRELAARGLRPGRLTAQPLVAPVVRPPTR
jgi:peptidoglycan/xylan/chitin deacetylase (PgdA/CDA1 family)